jgi:hypothetical protein
MFTPCAKGGNPRRAVIWVLFNDDFHFKGYLPVDVQMENYESNWRTSPTLVPGHTVKKLFSRLYAYTNELWYVHVQKKLDLDRCAEDRKNARTLRTVCFAPVCASGQALAEYVKGYCGLFKTPAPSCKALQSA